MKKPSILVVLLVLLVSLAVALPSAALAWKEGPGTNWYYIDAQYVDYHVSGTLDIEINGDPSAGQIFKVGDTVTITCDVHAYAAMCGGGDNEAYTDAELAVSGPSGSASDTATAYDYEPQQCAEVDTDTTLAISYDLTATGLHTVYVYSYAAVAWGGTDVDEDFLEASLTFEVVLEVDINIKPGSDPNSMNLKSKGVVPVAVLTTDDFDASTVDTDTVVFAGADPVRWTMEDVDGDGDMDMLFHFKTQELVLDETSTEAALTGATQGGDPIQGSDTVNIVPKGK